MEELGRGSPMSVSPSLGLGSFSSRRPPRWLRAPSRMTGITPRAAGAGPGAGLESARSEPPLDFLGYRWGARAQ